MSPSKIIHLPNRKFIGKKLVCNGLDFDRRALWSSFRLREGEVNHRIPSYHYAVREFKQQDLQTMIHGEIHHWACIEVMEIAGVPDGMEVLEMPKGEYAVFSYQGLTKDYGAFVESIFMNWLPQSGFALDHRPHFECMGPDYYGPMDPTSRETFFLPIRKIQ